MAFTFRSGQIPVLDLKNVKNNEDVLCRICFEAEESESKLIHPCKCSGSMKFVHEECLKLWILSSSEEIKNPFCDICKEPFKMEVQLGTQCSCKQFNEKCFNVFTFPLVFLVISTIFAIVLMYLIKGARNGSLRVEEKVYFSLVIFVCVSIMITLLYAFVKTMKKSCCIVKMKKWRIRSVKCEKHDETFDAVHQSEAIHTQVNQFENGSERVIQVHVPSSTVYRGINVIVPMISDVTLNRANREGSAFFSREMSLGSGSGTSRREASSVR